MLAVLDPGVRGVAEAPPGGAWARETGGPWTKVVPSPSEPDWPVLQATVTALMGPEPETLSMSKKHLEDLYRPTEEHIIFSTVWSHCTTVAIAYKLETVSVTANAIRV